MNLLITGAWGGAKEYIPLLEEKGIQIRFMQWEQDKLPCSSDWVEGIVCNGLFLHHSIEQFKNLRFIQLTSAGYDRVPMEYVREHGIKIYNARGVYSIPMAEFVLASVLQIYKKSSFFYENQKIQEWNKNRELCELFNKTVCIAGCGSVGSECAKRFQAFGCFVLGIDLQEREQEYFEHIYPIEQIEQVLPKVDILVLTLPLTKDTYHVINKKRIELMKKESILINISRGATIDTNDLIQSLKEERIKAVVLDVFEEEPLPKENELWKMDQVIITPHNSFVGEGNKERLTRVIVKNILKNTL